MLTQMLTLMTQPGRGLGVRNKKTKTKNICRGRLLGKNISKIDAASRENTKNYLFEGVPPFLGGRSRVEFPEAV